ncbi:MAG: hypothetical protein LBM01_00815 [Christensenellaceae bacterium]|jgi:hypothetical protein|nr:hypothetical protein [Christensenellaceae bacterium]
MINLLGATFWTLLLYAAVLAGLFGLIWLIRAGEQKIINRPKNRAEDNDAERAADEEFNRIRFERLRAENEALMEGNISTDDEVAPDEKLNDLKKIATPKKTAAATYSAFKSRDGVDLYNKEKKLVSKARKNERYGGLPKADAKELKKMKRDAE